MPGKYKNHHADDYESDDFETAETLIGRNKVSATPVKKRNRPSSASAKKKNPKRPVTPGKKRRVQSAPPTRSGHDLWMNAVKNRLTVGLASNKRPQSPRHKTAGEFWIDTLRKTGQGFTTESTGMNTFSGKRPKDKDMPYMSTSSYLRQMVGAEKPGRGTDPTAKPSPGTPAYKSQEEYYEQIIEYKKQVAGMNQEAATMKAKIRRLEEDNLKKEKEIDSLLHPQKSEELRRTLADKRPDSGAVIHSLKQKILKLETQLKDKETSYIKLQSDLKTTKIEEMKQQMEVFYGEIVRLQNSKDTGMDKSRSMGKEGTVKVKALNETILRLNKANEQLQAENRSLKEDLKNAIDDPKSPAKEYEDMNRKELLRAIAQLEKRLERAEKNLDGSSLVSYESKAAAVPGKISLDGSLEDRLDQLDKRESELLEIIEKKTADLKHIRAERNRWKSRCEELERRIGGNRGDYDEYARPSDASRPPSARPVSARSDTRRPLSARSEARTQASRPQTGQTDRGSRPPSRRRRTSVESEASVGRKQKIQAFKENRSAKTIQRHWRSHQSDVKNKKDSPKTIEQTSLKSQTEMESKTKTMEWLEKSQPDSARSDSLVPWLATPRTPSSQTGAESNLSASRKELRNTIEKSNSVSVEKSDSMSLRADKERIENFSQNRAAKVIQRRWTNHQYQKHEKERDEASDLIRSALMGHSNRRQQMSRYQLSEDDDDYETEDENYNECVNLIQSALYGHQARTSRMRDTRLSSTYDEDSEDDIIVSPKRSSISSRSNRPQSPQPYKSRPQSGRSRLSMSSGKGSVASYSRGSTYSTNNGDDDF